MDKHWTDTHILQDGDEWVAYDEAGLEHSRHPSKEDARDALEAYDHMLEISKGDSDGL